MGDGRLGNTPADGIPLGDDRAEPPARDGDGEARGGRLHGPSPRELFRSLLQLFGAPAKLRRWRIRRGSGGGSQDTREPKCRGPPKKRRAAGKGRRACPSSASIPQG